MKIINHKVASENNNDNLVNEVVAKDHIHFGRESGPKLVSEVVAKHNIHDDWMVKLLECPTHLFQCSKRPPHSCMFSRTYYLQEVQEHSHKLSNM